MSFLNIFDRKFQYFSLSTFRVIAVITKNGLDYHKIALSIVECSKVFKFLLLIH